jgi:hypothetical protein
MGLFKQEEGDVAVIVAGGVFKQVDLYSRDGYLFAKFGGGFIRLMQDGSTSKAKCRLDTLLTDLPLYRDALGRLCTDTVTGAKALDDARRATLLALPVGGNA